jgi:signal transduction histidine kinase/ActR/RegA family two-component response regulator
MEASRRQRFAKPYMCMVIGAGAAVTLFSIFHLDFSRLDIRFPVLVLITILIGSRVTIQIPRFKSEISVSDTFIFLTLLLYGGDAAVLLAVTEAFCSSRRITKKLVTLLFNMGVMACSTFFTAFMLRYLFGSLASLPRDGHSAQFIMALCVMALVHYVVNSGLVAIAGAFRSGQPIWRTWKSFYLWTSITYLAGAIAAGVTAKMVESFGFYAIVAMTPIIVIVHFTYQIYLKNIENSAAHAEQAERHVEELSRYIAEQERIREQFSELEKLSALGELASGVAHDFNNTLAGILGRAQILLRTKDPEKVERGLKIIIKSAEDGAKTVKRIQDFARQRRDHDFAPVCVDQLLFDVSEITRPRWKGLAQAGNVHINLDMQLHTDALILGDESELREVLVNMVFNAVDAMPTGGRLTLSATEEEESVVISVSDTGVGMTPEVRSRIFDPFFTTKGKAGMGLGLAVSYGIIRRHEGTIAVETEQGRGSTFKIKMPIAKGVVKAQEEMSAAVASISDSNEDTNIAAMTLPEYQSNKTRILVVDDEVFVRELLQDILESEDCEVTLADGGCAALDMFDPSKFDAVFTDIGMPGMSGWELARAIREQSKDIPLAVITGWGEAVGSSEQKEAQVDWVVTKPFTADRIAELAREVSRQKKEKPHGVKLTIAA